MLSIISPDGNVKLTSVTNSALNMQGNMSLVTMPHKCHNFIHKFVTLVVQ